MNVSGAPRWFQALFWLVVFAAEHWRGLVLFTVFVSVSAAGLIWFPLP